jgi:transposase-like protein
MSSKKITDADKLEIVDLYRQSGDTTTSLANRYGVSNSTISRILKNGIPEAEYETLIQQKRGSKAGSEDDRPISSAEPSEVASIDISSELDINYDRSQPNSVAPTITADSPAVLTLANQDRELSLVSAPVNSIEDLNDRNRRVRRRASAPEEVATNRQSTIDRRSIAADLDSPVAKIINEVNPFDPMQIGLDIGAIETNLPTKPTISPPIPRTPVLREILTDSENRYLPPVIAADPFDDRSIDELDEDVDTEDVNVLAAMFGEEIADGEDADDPDDDSEEDWDDDATSSYEQLNRDRILTSDRLHVQVTPLSQATLPRTCYIVIDKFAELIVRPLKDFADLGQIAGEEIQQRTLPVFDNHRVAKRFSNQRTQRVIKIPDSQVFYKTTHHLRSKGITRLLVDGNIYSLN